MASEQKLELLVKVNQDSGALDVVAGKFKTTSDAAKSTEKSFLGLSEGAKTLAASLIGVFSARAIISFMADSVREAEKEDAALRRLKFTVEALGGSWDKTSQSVQEWASAIQKTTRFADDQAYGSLDRLTRVMGNVKQAQLATVLAMNLSVASGKELSETEEIIVGLVLGREKALKQANKEFGAFIGQSKTAQEALDKLAKAFDGVAESEQSVTKETAKLTHVWGDFKETVGRMVEPPLIRLIDLLSKSAEGYEKLVNKFKSPLTGDEARKAMGDLDINKVLDRDSLGSSGAEKSAQNTTRIIARESEKQLAAIEKTYRQADAHVKAYYDQIDQFERNYRANQENLLQEALSKEKEFSEKRIEQAKQTAQTIGRVAGDAIADMILDGKSFEDVMTGIMKNIERAAIQAITQILVMKAMTSAMGGVGGGPMGAPSAFGAPGMGGGGRASGAPGFTDNGRGLLLPGGKSPVRSSGNPGKNRDWSDPKYNTNNTGRNSGQRENAFAEMYGDGQLAWGMGQGSGSVSPDRIIEMITGIINSGNPSADRQLAKWLVSTNQYRVNLRSI